jgi:hypothetical protein
MQWTAAEVRQAAKSPLLTNIGGLARRHERRRSMHPMVRDEVSSTAHRMTPYK